MRRYLMPTPALALGLLVTGMAAPAAASNPTPVSQCPGGVCMSVASPAEPGGTVAGTSAGAATPQAIACTNLQLSGFESADLELISPHTGQAGSWYLHSCQAPGGGLIQAPVWLPFQPSRTVQRPVVSPGVLAQQAYRLLPIPTPELGVNPPADQPQLVNLPTWLWVSQATWGTRTATVSVPGESVTATATPVQVAWVMGDGSTVVCNGPGSAYDPTRPPDAQRSSCTHTYGRSSAGEPDQRFAVSATATWRVAWQATGLLPTNGQLPPLQRTAQLALQVAEAQTLN